MFFQGTRAVTSVSFYVRVGGFHTVMRCKGPPSFYVTGVLIAMAGLPLRDACELRPRGAGGEEGVALGAASGRSASVPWVLGPGHGAKLS